jgi:hypothetical protein
LARVKAREADEAERVQKAGEEAVRQAAVREAKQRKRREAWTQATTKDAALALLQEGKVDVSEDPSDIFAAAAKNNWFTGTNFKPKATDFVGRVSLHDAPTAAGLFARTEETIVQLRGMVDAQAQALLAMADRNSPEAEAAKLRAYAALTALDVIESAELNELKTLAADEGDRYLGLIRTPPAGPERALAVAALNNRAAGKADLLAIAADLVAGTPIAASQRKRAMLLCHPDGLGAAPTLADLRAVGRVDALLLIEAFSKMFAEVNI